MDCSGCVVGHWVACGRFRSILGPGAPSALRIGTGVTITGAILWLFAFASDSIVPVIIHAAMDLIAGDV